MTLLQNGVPAGPGSYTLPIAGIANVTGVIDCGTARGNTLYEFAINDADLAGVYGDQGITINVDITKDFGNGPVQAIEVINNAEFGLIILADTGLLVQDDLGQAGIDTTSITTDPSVTLNWDVTGSPAAYFSALQGAV
jgi:hypothetical protein